MLRDYNHASRLYVGDQYRLVPKMGFLFHVFLDVGTNASSYDARNPTGTQEVGLLARSADLPRFTADSKVFNSYNRPSIVQTKIKYDTVTITFNDDSADVVKNFWIRYFKHYYRDSDYSLGQYNMQYRYGEPMVNEFGFGPLNAAKFLRSVRIYSLTKKTFSEYILVNPIIKSCRFGQHVNGESEVLKTEMSVDYESVLYSSGSVGANEISGFADLHYDSSPSSLTVEGGGSQPLFGPGGYIDTNKIINPSLTNGSYGDIFYSTRQGAQNFRSTISTSASVSQVSNIFSTVLRENKSTNRVTVPTFAGAAGFSISDNNGIEQKTSLASLPSFGKTNDQISSITISGAQIKETPSPTSNYFRSFPPNSSAGLPTSTPSELNIINDQDLLRQDSNQRFLDVNARRLAIDNRILSLQKELSIAEQNLSGINSQINTINSTNSSLISKYNNAASLPQTPQRDTLLEQYQQTIDYYDRLKNDLISERNFNSHRYDSLNQELDNLKAEKGSIV